MMQIWVVLLVIMCLIINLVKDYKLILSIQLVIY